MIIFRNYNKRRENIFKILLTFINFQQVNLYNESISIKKFKLRKLNYQASYNASIEFNKIL